jgi:diguanylate cyclase (GGDEF)-like protein
MCLDSSYILSTINPVAGLLFALTFFLIWRQQPDRLHILHWGAAFFLGSLGFSFEFLNYFDPMFRLSDGANIFVPICVTLIARGVCLRYTGNAPTRLLILILGVTYLTASWINFVHQNAFGRGLTISIGIVALLSVATRAILNYRARDRIDLGILLTLLAASILLLGRPVLSLFIEGAPQKGVIEDTSFWAVSMKVAGLYSLLVFAILFMLRIAADLFAELNQQSVTDLLSGLLNRRGFFAAAETLALEANPSLPISVLLLDIDHFKHVNDNYGHQTGDKVIRTLADLMLSSAPQTTVVGRLGGEEFAIFLPNTGSTAALAFAEALRTSIRLQDHAGIPATHPVTVSIGVAEGTGEDLEVLLHLADIGLYKAKNSGRDQVRMAGRETLGEQGRRRSPKLARA